MNRSVDWGKKFDSLAEVLALGRKEHIALVIKSEEERFEDTEWKF